MRKVETVRKNIQEVISAWNWNRHKSHLSCSTDGVSIFSYDTCILTPLDAGMPDVGPFVFNVTKYSPTTSGQQTAIRAMSDVALLEVDHIPICAGADYLRSAGQFERASK